ncbi:MAG: bifunctional hydroxymethylpyrimidine kinase/phosphomethylpyrimidine kinase [Desulforhopalus sp.]|nr:bifunctional hydroxymethylpyrimidine kinase/phosphomethylpyrimidine kinase [Desulforhopalus sp.]
MKKILTIAGSDCSGGAGIQADIKTITAHRMYAMSAITALTAQNTTGVFAIMEAEPEFVAQQLDSIFTDIRPDAVKIGMVSNGRIIEAIARKLIEYNADNIVVDPVMVSTSGSALLSEDARQSLITTLLPLGRVITPNIPEAEVLSKMKIHNEEDMVAAALIISREIGGAVLLKGGHSVSDANDLLLENGDTYWFKAERILTTNTHGTGCTLSSAIACNLADGMSLRESIKNAKEYLSGALAAGLDLGKGSGPVNHIYRLQV